MVFDGAEDAESVDDIVGDEVGRGVVRFAVVGVVVTLAGPNVVGERVRHIAVFAIACDEVGHVVAYHATEPAALVALVGQVSADVGRGGDADLYAFRVTAGVSRRVVDVLHGPVQDHGVSELQDETVGLAPYEAQGLGAVAGHPHVELSVADPGDTDFDAGVIDLASLGQLLYDVYGFF